MNDGATCTSQQICGTLDKQKLRLRMWEKLQQVTWDKYKPLNCIFDREHQHFYCNGCSYYCRSMFPNIFDASGSLILEWWRLPTTCPEMPNRAEVHLGQSL
jgi:hypothetical protein